jgi:hypothetical protein
MPCPVTGCKDCLCYKRTNAYAEAVKYHADKSEASSMLNASWLARNENHFRCVTENLLKDSDLSIEEASDQCNNARSSSHYRG